MVFNGKRSRCQAVPAGNESGAGKGRISMVAANVKIIEGLKLFLSSVVDDPAVRSVFITNPSDFSRVRKLPLKKIVGILINLPKRSLSIELQDFFECW